MADHKLRFVNLFLRVKHNRHVLVHLLVLMNHQPVHQVVQNVAAVEASAEAALLHHLQVQEAAAAVAVVALLQEVAADVNL